MNARKLVASMVVSALAIGTTTGALAADVKQDEVKATEVTYSVTAMKAGQGSNDFKATPDGVKFSEIFKEGESIPAFQMTEANLAIAIPDNLDALSDAELAKLKAELQMNDEEFAKFKIELQMSDEELAKITADGKNGEAVPMMETTMAIAIPDNLNALSDAELAKLKAELQMNDEEFATFKADMQKMKTEMQNQKEEDGTGAEVQAQATLVAISAANTAK